LAENLRDGRYSAATANFDAAMLKAVSPEALKLAWISVADTSGGFESFGTPQLGHADGFTTVTIPSR
jgi:hypothetical protein